MKLGLLVLILLTGAARADQITTIRLDGRWRELPYCQGQVRMACEAGADPFMENKCYVEFNRTSCRLIHMYTASTFYPYVWTIQNLPVVNRQPIFIQQENTSGVEKPYFFAFLHGGGESYDKIRFELPPR